MNDDRIHELLQRTLSSTDTPSRELDQKTKIMMKERVPMHRQAKFTLRLALAVVAILMLSSVSVYAAVKYLTAQQVAEHFQFPRLAEAFASSDSLLINKTISSAGYDITLLGTVFGKDLTGFSNHVAIEKTYAVLAIQKQGGKMPAVASDEYGQEDFFVSPLVKGHKPWQFNIFTMQEGGSTTYTIDGIMYRLIECDSVEPFADKGVYIGVSNNNDVFCNNESFRYNEETGEITPNPDHGCVSVIFDLPIDQTKADPAKAQMYLDHLQAAAEADQADTNTTSLDSIDWEAATIDPTTEVTVTLDSDNNVHFSFQSGDGSGGNGSVPLSEVVFKEGQTGLSEPILIMESAGEDLVPHPSAFKLFRDEQGNLQGFLVRPN